MKKNLFLSLLFVSAYILMAQQNNSSHEFVAEIWEINHQSAAVIVNYIGTSKQIVIPNQINGCPVAGIGKGAFRSRYIKSVIFPPTIVFIGDYAFFDNRITSILLPAGITSIGVAAFDNNVLSSGRVPLSSSYTAGSSSSRTPDATSYTPSSGAIPPSGSVPAINTHMFKIEPAHSETVYVQKPKPQSVNIFVTPGYNPVGQPSSIVTVQEKYPGPAPVPVTTGGTSAYRAPVQPQNMTLRQQQLPQPMGQEQQVSPQGYTQQYSSASSNKDFKLVPETTVDVNKINLPSSAVPDESEQIYLRGLYPIWQTPAPR
jgi:hypothetical protein